MQPLQLCYYSLEMDKNKWWAIITLSWMYLSCHRDDRNVVLLNQEIPFSNLEWEHVSRIWRQHFVNQIRTQCHPKCTFNSFPFFPFNLLCLALCYKQNQESNPHTICKQVLTNIHIHDSIAVGTNSYSCGVYLQYNSSDLAAALKMISYYAS